MTEKTNTYTIKQGDSYPSLEIALLDDDGNPLVLTPYYSVALVIAPCVGGRRLIDEAVMTCKGANPQAGDDIGKVVYDWQPGDTDKPGEYLLEVVLSHQGVGDTDQKRTSPRSNYDKLVIIPRL